MQAALCRRYFDTPIAKLMRQGKASKKTIRVKFKDIVKFLSEKSHEVEVCARDPNCESRTFSDLAATVRTERTT